MLTTVARKTLMALTGLFLCVFLAVHLLGNLQLFLPEETARRQFNWYAHVLSGQPVIKVAAWLTYLSVIAHSVWALILTVRNRRAAGRRYAAASPAREASWVSRSMGVLGLIILLFLFVHLSDFWWPFKFGGELAVDDFGHRDLYGLVVRAFAHPWRVVFYATAMGALGFHLAHGISSGLRSLGLHHRGYTWALRWLSVGFAIVVSAGFAAMPLYLFATRN